MPRHELPVAIARRHIERAFVEQHGHPIEQRPVNAVALPDRPAQIGGREEDVLFFEVIDPARRRGRADQIPTSRVQEAFRAPGGAGGVHDRQRVLALHRLRRNLIPRRLIHRFVPPEVALGAHGDRELLLTDTPDHERVLHRGALGQRDVHVVFEWHKVAAMIAAVRGDDHAGAAIRDAVA